MAKLQIKSKIIATYGGIFQIMEVFERIGLGKFIDSSLGKRDANWNLLKYSEVIETIFCTIFTVVTVLRPSTYLHLI